MTSPSEASPQTVMITGGHAGLGYFCTQAIAAAHPTWHVILGSRDQQRAAHAVDALKAVTGNQQIETMPLDLASLASIRAFARALATRSLPPLRAVVCNAGTQVVSGTTYTEDGFEMTFGVNCLGHFLLVNLLLHLLVAPARIIFVSSDVHNSEGQGTIMGRLLGVIPPRYHDARASAWPERYPDAEEEGISLRVMGMRRYATSKLCDIWYTYELARRLQSEGYSTSEHPITVNAFNPGLTPGTGLARTYGPFQRFGWNLLLPALRVVVPGIQRQDASGKALARLILDPMLENISGKYFDGITEVSSSQESYDQQQARDLWETSAELVHLESTETILRVGRSQQETC